MSDKASDQGREKNRRGASEESKAIGARNIEELVAFFVDEFLRAAVKKGGPLKDDDYQVIFACGTVVRVRLSKDQVDAKWKFDPRWDYPTHRVEDRKHLQDIWNENEHAFQQVLTAHPEQKEVIRAAYHKLIQQAGYPLPGGPGGDTNTLPLAQSGDAAAAQSVTASDQVVSDALAEHSPTPQLAEKKVLWGTFFEKEGIFSLSCSSSTETMTADAQGREARRMDFMLPRIHAIVCHNLSVLKL